MSSVHGGIFDQSGRADATLGLRCSRVVSGLRAMRDEAVIAVLADPRALHRALFHDLTPEDSPEMAGNFRGSDYPSLNQSEILFAFNDTQGTAHFARPYQVAGLMTQYGALMRACGFRSAATVGEKLAVVSPLLVLFGLIHPFIDGNGHMQRLTAQCLFERAGFAMSRDWRVHPCPYQEEMHRALAAADMQKVATLLKRFVE